VNYLSHFCCLFEGVFDEDVALSSPATIGQCDAFFVCPDCPAPDPFTDAPETYAQIAYDTVEMAIVLGHSALRCENSHRALLPETAPALSMQPVSSLKMSSDDVASRLQVISLSLFVSQMNVLKSQSHLNVISRISMLSQSQSHLNVISMLSLVSQCYLNLISISISISS